MYPDVKTWRTETPLCSRRDLNFYINKLGFMAYRIDDPTDMRRPACNLSNTGDLPDNAAARIGRCRRL